MLINRKLKLSDLKAGDTLVADGGFDCLNLGQSCVVLRDADKRLYVSCSEGRHYLDGQVDHEDQETIVGFTRV